MLPSVKLITKLVTSAGSFCSYCALKYRSVGITSAERKHGSLFANRNSGNGVLKSLNVLIFFLCFFFFFKILYLPLFSDSIDDACNLTASSFNRQLMLGYSISPLQTGSNSTVRLWLLWLLKYLFGLVWFFPSYCL